MFLRRERKSTALDGREVGKNWEELAGRKTVIRIYCIKNIFSILKNCFRNKTKVIGPEYWMPTHPLPSKLCFEV